MIFTQGMIRGGARAATMGGDATNPESSSFGFLRTKISSLATLSRSYKL